MKRVNESLQSNSEAWAVRSKQAYIDITAQGTERRGLAEEDLDRVFNDRRTFLLPYGSKLIWPLITPIGNHSEYFKQYFQGQDDVRNYSYLTLPSPDVLEANPEFKHSVVELIKYAINQGQKLIYEDAPDNSISEFLERHKIDTGVLRADSLGENISSTESLNDIQSKYIEAVKSFTLGPQIEGIDPELMEQVLEDERTYAVEIMDDNGDTIKAPFLVPIEYAPWLNPSFISKSGTNLDTLYFSALPQALLSQNKGVIDPALKDIIEQKGGVNVLIDYPEFVRPFYKNSSHNYQVNDLVTANDTPAAVYHYKISVSSNDSEALKNLALDPAIKKIPKDEIDAHFERMWKIYSEQFKALVDDHPVNGALSKDELHQALLSPTSTTFAYSDAEGQVQAFGYYERNIAKCPWLNSDFFSSRSDYPSIYMPGIVSARELELPVSHKIMQAVLYSNVQKYKTWNMTFECSNLSATYIPKLVQRLTQHEKIAEYGELEEIKHYYEVVKFTA